MFGNHGFFSPSFDSYPHQDPFGMHRRPFSALSREEEQRRLRARKREQAEVRQREEAREHARQRQEHALDEAKAQLYHYGFRNEDAVDAVLAEYGPDNLKKCVRVLLENERRAKNNRAQTARPTEAKARRGSVLETLERDQQRTPPPPPARKAPSTSASPQSSRSPSPSTSPAASASPSPTPSPTPSPRASESMEVDTPALSREEAAQVLQATIRARAEQRDVSAVAACREKTEATLVLADEHAKQWSGVLREEWRETKMLQGVPVELIAYEEALLKLQMELDNVTAGNVSDAARQAVRSMRRDAVKSIQQKLDGIDQCRQWWLSTGAKSTAAHTVGAQATAAA